MKESETQNTERAGSRSPADGSVFFDIYFPGELSAGLHPYSDEVTVTYKSGQWGGSPGEFEEYMRDCLKEWYDGAAVTPNNELSHSAESKLSNSTDAPGRSLLERGMKAAEGAQVLAELYFKQVDRDPFNNDNYCRLLDWMNDVRRALGKQPNAEWSDGAKNRKP